MSTTAEKTYVGGTAGNNDLSATNDTDGTYIEAGAGNDILRGGRYSDVVDGGSGDDQMVGGGGADQFRFFGNQIEGASDTDKIYDLNFGEGDTLVFGEYGAGTFTDDTGVNAYTSGTAATISSFAGLVNAAADSANVTAYAQSPYNNNLVFSITDQDGQVQNIVISNAYSQYIAAGGSDGL